MNTVTEKTELAKVGLFNKFDIRRTDGSSEPGGKHHGDVLFALNFTTDADARATGLDYARRVAARDPQLASDLRAEIRALMPSEFVTIRAITVPDITLPDGTFVPGWTEPEFTVGRYLSTIDEDGIATVQVDAIPTVNIDLDETNAANEKAGMKLITERQYVAVSWLLTQVGANWTSGEVGVGDLRQGLHKGSVDEVQSNDYVPEDQGEDRRFYLPDGTELFDWSGHIFTRTFDNVQGDERGVVAKPFAKDSISISLAPFASMTRGVGYVPKAGDNWSGSALVRGGHWHDGGDAGVFRLDHTRPGSDYYSVGFRSTK